mmetsp:Transcript_10747/g.14628  ORF Transcript_10747/g.14628 Transcript_10747/m.14628 type:complete len:206 (+) Transcript_10747:462-1079(+)
MPPTSPAPPIPPPSPPSPPPFPPVPVLIPSPLPPFTPYPPIPSLEFGGSSESASLLGSALSSFVAIVLISMGIFGVLIFCIWFFFYRRNKDPQPEQMQLTNVKGKRYFSVVGMNSKDGNYEEFSPRSTSTNEAEASTSAWAAVNDKISPSSLKEKHKMRVDSPEGSLPFQENCKPGYTGSPSFKDKYNTNSPGRRNVHKVVPLNL